MVYVEEKETGFKITGFPAHSVAEKAGVKKGDLILTADDVEIKSISDLKVHLHYKDTGDITRLKIFRPTEQEEDQVEDKEKGEEETEEGEVEGEEVVIDVTL